ncbi:hypothetical protein [Vibrio sp. B1REV9]|nr:hypothetical protein [Vibrio sp. B1REV9]
MKNLAWSEWLPLNGEKSLFSFAQGIDLSESHLRHEIEVDLIGAYFEEHR